MISDLFDDIVLEDLYRSSPPRSLQTQALTNNNSSSKNLASGDTRGTDNLDSPLTELSIDVPESPPSEPVLLRSPYETRSKKGAAASNLKHTDNPKSGGGIAHSSALDTRREKKKRKVRTQ